MNKYLTISIQHPDITMLRIEVDKQVIKPKHINNIYYFRVQDLNNVEVFFEPWCIQPLVRFGYHLVNYGMAGINQWNHKLDFVADLNWAEKYFEQIVYYKKQYIGQTDQLNSDAYLGIDSFHWDIVEQIENKL